MVAPATTMLTSAPEPLRSPELQFYDAMSPAMAAREKPRQA